MSFFSNRIINYLNLNNSLFELMSQMSNVFVVLFLYAQGFALYSIFYVLAIIFTLRSLTRFCVLPLIRLMGLRKTIMLGVLGNGVALLLLSQVEGIDGWFYGYIAIFAIFNAMYWVCFHTMYSLCGDAGHRGKQYAMRTAFVLCWQALFPLLGGVLIQRFGYSSYFYLSLPIMLLAITPLLYCPDITLPCQNGSWSPLMIKSYGVKTSLFWSFFDSVATNSWILTIYIFFAGKMVSFGGLLSFGILIQIVWQLGVGRKIDMGTKRRFALIGIVIMGLVVIARALVPLSVEVIMGLEMVYAIGKLNVVSIKDVGTYNEAQANVTPLYYWMVVEIIRDAGNILGLLAVALLLQGGVQMREAMFIALPALLLLDYIIANTIKNQVIYQSHSKIC